MNPVLLAVQVGSSMEVGLIGNNCVAVVVIVETVVSNGGVKVTTDRSGGWVIVETTVTGAGVTVVV